MLLQLFNRKDFSDTCSKGSSHSENECCVDLAVQNVGLKFVFLLLFARISSLG